MTEERLENLKTITEIQTQEGIWNKSPYQHGLANGLLLALHIMEGDKGKDPEYLKAPEKFLIENVQNKEN